MGLNFYNLPLFYTKINGEVFECYIKSFCIKLARITLDKDDDYYCRISEALDVFSIVLPGNVVAIIDSKDRESYNSICLYDNIEDCYNDNERNAIISYNAKTNRLYGENFEGLKMNITPLMGSPSPLAWINTTNKITGFLNKGKKRLMSYQWINDKAVPTDSLSIKTYYDAISDTINWPSEDSMKGHFKSKEECEAAYVEKKAKQQNEDIVVHYLSTDQKNQFRMSKH